MTIRLGGVPEHFNLPWRLALETGEIDDVGAEWEDQPGGTGEMLAKLAVGELDLVSILTEGCVAAIAEGLPVTILQTYVSSPLEWGVHVPGECTTETEAQLQGARIAISRERSGSHLMAFVWAQANGWSLSDDQFVVVGSLDGAVDAFAHDEADVFLWDRFMTRNLVGDGAFRLIGVQPSPWPPFVIAVRDEVLARQTTEVGRIVDAVVAAATGLHNCFDIDALLNDRYGLDAGASRAWLESTCFAQRQAWSPSVGNETLASLAAAGFTS